MTPRAVHLSVVSPVYQAEDCVEELHRRLVAVLEPITPDFEIILVDDRSRDGSWAKIRDLASRDPRVRGMRLTRNFGQHQAVAAGVDASRGRWVVVMDCDLQDRPEDILALYRRATEDDCDCVMARRTVRHDNWFRRVASRLFFRIFGHLADLPEYDGSVSNFSIISRRVAVQLGGLQESARFYPGLLFWLGWPSAFVDVTHASRHSGQTTYSPVRLLRHAARIILAHSSRPLYYTALLGLLLALSSVAVGLFYLAWAFIFGIGVQGWATLVISIYLSTGMIIFSLGIAGLYIARIHTESKKRPLYVVQEIIEQHNP